MIDRSVDLLLRRSEMRVRLSCNFRDNMTRCVEKSLKAIVQSRQLLANSAALLSYPEFSEPEDQALASRTPEHSPTGSLPVISKRDFVYELVSTDGKHFCDCSFRNCTLLYTGVPVTFESCRFHDCKFELTGAAGRTVQFLDCFGLLAERSDQSCCESADSALTFVN